MALSAAVITTAIVCVLHPTMVHAQLLWRQMHNGTHDDAGNITSVPPSRSDPILAYDVARRQLVLFGGRPGPMDDTWIYSLTTNEWREVNATLRPPARHGAVGGVSGDYFYITTGRGDNNHYYNDVWRLSLRNETWELLPSSPEQVNLLDIQKDNDTTDYVYDDAPPSRYSAAGGIYGTGTLIYISLGTSGERTDDTYAYDTTSNTWYKGAEGCEVYDPRCPHPRYLQSSLMTGRDELVIFSGCLSGGGAAGPCPSTDAWRYDGRSKQWTRLDGCPAARLYGSMAMLPSAYNRRVAVLYGGQTDAYNNIEASTISDDEVAILDVDTGFWTVRYVGQEGNSSGVPVHRVSAAMATGPDGVFLFGGSSHHGVYANDLWLLLGNASDVDLSPTLPCARTTMTFMTVHGILMTIGFGFLLPLGALFARYIQNMYGHIALQISGLLCALAGLAVGVVSVSTNHFCVVHAYVGIVALGLAVLQPVNALFRPKSPSPEELKGLARRVWESLHRLGGRSALLLGVANVSLGIFMSVADLPIVAVWHAWLCLLLLSVLVIELVRCFSRMHRKSIVPRLLTCAGGMAQSDGSIINGWDKFVDSAYVNPATESVRL